MSQENVQIEKMEDLEKRYKSVKVYDNVAVVQDYRWLWGVVSLDGAEIVPFGRYGWIDGFDSGLARVRAKGRSFEERKNAKWGVINVQGEEVLPVEYDNIWNFLGKNRQSTTVEKGGEKSNVYFCDLNPDLEYKPRRQTNHYWHEYEDDWREEEHYETFSGSYAQEYEGLSDEYIWDAFGGEADAYWNID